MAGKHRKYKTGPAAHWSTSAFDTLQATWSPDRVARDEALLKLIFSLAEDCPLMQEALDWADAHGVKFFIDRTAQNCGGYHWPGTPVVGIAADALRKYGPAFMADVVVHETRHAWQDYHGFTAWNDRRENEGDFRKFFINNAMVEADAYAYGTRAEEQYELAQLMKRRPSVGRDFQIARMSHLEDENRDLASRFPRFFTGNHIGKYGAKFAQDYGVKWGVREGEFHSENFEHHPAEPNMPGINLDNLQDVMALGQSFSGAKNYFTALPKDFLARKILRPALADAFWGAAGPCEKSLTRDIRKAVGFKKRPRHAWP